MGKNIILLSFLAFISCVSLSPKKEREVSFISETKIKKDEAYDRALIWFAKNLNNSNWAVQIKDKPNGRIVSNVKYQCNKMDSFGSIVGDVDYISFSLDVTTKDNKIRVIFEDVVYLIANRHGVESVEGPSDRDELKYIEQNCLNYIRRDLMNAVNGVSYNTRSDNF
ncbi:DUF4468 domain-containing protein [Leptospira semungkisensis]|uniref:DUF4468 domain-containing protein n=1 Tax=Leptospira semungkisensis TaxID=2484985 RepID=A0A4V3JBY8_9LEPT|nr:DUF4468 domain-containing protein [Leptospira semungkisensis]TGK04029.1 DUF4468 domain-containing protein [Leptospira semungkisensis]